MSRGKLYYEKKPMKKDPLERDVLQIYRRHNANYGAHRIKVELEKQGQIISRRRIGKILKRHELESKHGRPKLAKNMYTAKDGRYIVENLIKGEEVTASKQVWQMDVSQFPYRGGKLYVNGIIDVYNKVVTAKCGSRENKELISETIAERLKIERPLIIHTDRGLANISGKVKELLEANGVRRSMSAPHKPNENQYIESFWKTMKTEIGNTRNLTLETLKMVIDYYLHYYNTERIHSSIGYLTPEQMRRIS